MATYQQRIARYYKARVLFWNWIELSRSCSYWLWLDSSGLFLKVWPCHLSLIWGSNHHWSNWFCSQLNSISFNRLVAKGKASFPSGREEGATPIKLREEKKGYFTRLATELTQGSRKERASRQLRQQKLELRNTEEKRIQLNLSLS